jgi:hypothetical protein
MSTRRIEPRSLQELLNELEGLPEPPSGIENRNRLAILVRLVEQQEASAQVLAESIKSLGLATSRLVHATWGLVGTTLVLVSAEVILKLVGKS